MTIKPFQTIKFKRNGQVIEGKVDWISKNSRGHTICGVSYTGNWNGIKCTRQVTVLFDNIVK